MTTPLNPYQQQKIINGLRKQVGSLERWRIDLTPLLAGPIRDSRAPGGASDINVLLADILTTAGDVLYWDGTEGQRLPLGAANEVMTVGSGAPQWTSDLRDIDSIGSGSSVPSGNLLDFQSGTVNAGAALGNWWVGNFNTFPGVAHIGYYGLTKGQFYSHALVQLASGATALNAAAGQTVGLTINGGTALAIGVDAFIASSTLGTFGVPIVLQNGTSINEFSTDGTMAGNSDDAVPTEKAVVTYVDSQIPMTQQTVTGTASVTLVDAHRVVTADTTGGVCEIDLPEASVSTGLRVVAIREDPSNGGDAMEINSQGSDRINGTLTTVSYSRPYQTKVFYSDGTGWYTE